MAIDPSILETRSLGTSEFKFLVVNSPEKWEPAKDILYTFPMVLPNTGKRLDIPMKGTSYGDMRTIWAKYTIPIWDRPDVEAPPAFQAAVQEMQDKRIIAQVELATGMEMPGKTFEEKRDWMNRCNPADMGSIQMFVIREVANTDNYVGPYLQAYNELRRYFPEETGVTISSFDQFLQETSEVIHRFTMNRHGQDYLVEFPLKGLSQTQRQEIEDQTKEPTPPMIPVFHPVTNQPIPGQTKQNPSDPGYLRAMNRLMQKRTLLFLNACLPFKIPGDNEEGQLTWLGDRLVGDVMQLNNYINQVILGVEGRYAFFTNG